MLKIPRKKKQSLQYQIPKYSFFELTLLNI